MRLGAKGVIHNAYLGIDVHLPIVKLIYNRLKTNYDYELYLSIVIRVCCGVSPLHEHGMCYVCWRKEYSKSKSQAYCVWSSTWFLGLELLSLPSSSSDIKESQLFDDTDTWLFVRVKLFLLYFVAPKLSCNKRSILHFFFRSKQGRPG